MPQPLWGSRRALWLLLLLSETRKALIAAMPSASAKAKSRMEIREQDYSFSDGARERTVIEVVTKDVRTADIFNIMQAIGHDNDAVKEAPTSWWSDDELSRQDLLLLLLVAVCIVRLLVFAVQMAWRLVRLALRWLGSGSSEESDSSEAEQDTDSDGTTRERLAVVQSCHLQFLLVVDKLKREMRENEGEQTQQMVASLELHRREDWRQVTLDEILATLAKIQAMDSSFARGEQRLASLKQEDEEHDLPQAWARLQDVYASFLRIQETIVRRQQRRSTWRRHLEQLDQQHQQLRRRQHRLPSSDESVDEVLHELQTMELPQGFTSDMFTSLGNALHDTMETVEGSSASPRPAATRLKKAVPPSPHKPRRGTTRAA